MKKLIVHTYDYGTINGKGIKWLCKNVPNDRKYVDAREKDMFSQCGKHIIETVQYGKGFYFVDENDPLYIEFVTKFPNAKYRIED